MTPFAQEIAYSPDGPLDAGERLAGLPHRLALHSADRGSPRGRYSFVSADPLAFGPSPDPFHDRSRSFDPPTAALPGLPPFQGGLAGLWGYGLCHTLERLPMSRFDEFDVPDAGLGVYDWVLSWDHAERRCWAVAWRETRLRAALAWLESGTGRRVADCFAPVTLAPCFPLDGRPGVWSNFSRGGYEAAVRRAVEYVHAGDCFQVNLSQRLLAPQRGDAWDLFRRSCERNPAPFAGFLDLGPSQVVSCSPERFLSVTPGGKVEARPIKGTRPFGETPERDAELVRDLLSNPKDRAENVMIVDLLRNDLGRSCRFGTVRATRVCELESYRHVHHLVSEVVGELTPGRGPLDLLRAAFPGGSVTGAPKVRAMEIIAELEPTARGPYCGSLGYVGFDGATDTSILIRTFTAAGGWLQFPVGGGVVADSEPAAEYRETLVKAEGLLRTL